MAYDTYLADRVRNIFKDKGISPVEKRMMGGLTFMVDDKMCVGVHTADLMARIGPDAYDSALLRPGCRKMLFTGREMKGFVFVGPDGVDMDSDLEYWVDLALEYNPKAKSSKKKKR